MLGVGGIVFDDSSKTFVRQSDFIEILERCLDRGIHYIDTAEVYGIAENVLGLRDTIREIFFQRKKLV